MYLYIYILYSFYRNGERPVIKNELVQMEKKEVEFDNRVRVNSENIEEVEEKIKSVDEKYMKIIKIVSTTILTILGTLAQIFLH